MNIFVKMATVIIAVKSGHSVAAKAHSPIRPSEDFSIFYLEEPYRLALLRADDETLNQVRAEFRRVSSHILMNVTFCSAGKSCDLVATEDETCQ
jgi:hypothetical protein